MSVQPGARLGPYEVVSLLGAGGMGEVYRARDTKLNRDVAVKVLPDTVAADPERLARFHREAQVLASLNHPHIAHIHGYEESNGIQALVMELVEGPTLADRIARGPIPLNEALPIARQIAEALEAAHEQGIIHRDLKPANVKVREDGTVKVLDFGLAKLAEPTSPSTPSATMSPTLSLNATMAGVILGTAAYMPPEQARGKTVDKRADIWAFGAVLYEMLTGRRAFDGDDVSLTLAAVMMKDPDWAGLPVGVAGSVRTLLRRCLERDPKNRLRDIGEARIQLEQSLKGESDEGNQVQHAAPQQRSRVALILVALLSLLLVISIAAGIYGGRPPRQNEVRFDIDATGTPNPYQITISPDGRVVAFVARVASNSGVPAVWIRPLSSRVAQPLTGTEGATNPFWSPDSRYIGFAADGKLKKIDVAGGPAQTVCDVANFAGGTWNRQGVVVFSAGGRLSRVPATGGQPIPISKLDAARQEFSHAWPYFLPDGTHFLYLARSAVPENHAIFVASLDSPERTLVINIDSMGVYAPPGYVIFARDGALMALAFEPRTLKTSGDPIRIADDVGVNRGNGRGAFAVADEGVLVYRSDVTGNIAQPTWFDRDGKMLGTAGEEGLYRSMALSPDQKRVAISRFDLRTRNLDIWVLELATSILTRLTTDPANDDDPVWAPDGQAVAFWSLRNGKYDFYLHTIGRGEDTMLFESSETPKYIDDWSKDGKFLLYRVASGTGLARAILALPLTGERKPITLTQSSSFTKDESHFSPDGTWVAFNSNESGNSEVYVASFPTFENRRQVSSRGGGVPRWAGDGRELFYLSPDGKMTAVAVKPGSTLEFGTPTTLFQTPIRSPNLALDQYAVSADGKRFLMLSPTTETTANPITVVVNWPNALSK